MTVPLPTKETYEGLQSAYDYFNKALFGGTLPACLITLQRQRGSYGYFCAQQFKNRGAARTDEIAMNPRYLVTRGDAESLSTLVHEQVHLWQQHFGKPGRGRYHNMQWAHKMESLGLMPSDTAQPGGKKVGDSVSHYIVKGGPFDLACQKLIADGFSIPWGDAYGDDAQAAGGAAGEGEEGGEGRGRRNKSNREKFTCPGCELHAWAKPKSKLICGECGVEMEGEFASLDEVDEAA